MKQPRNLGRSQARPVCAVCGEYIWKGVKRHVLRAGHLLDGSWDVHAKLCDSCLTKLPGLRRFLLVSQSPVSELSRRQISSLQVTAVSPQASQASSATAAAATGGTA